MSYCRPSSDNFKSDIYCYEGSSGFVVHISANRILGDIPPLPEMGSIAEGLLSQEEYIAAYKAQGDFIATAEKENILLSYAGETKVYAEVSDCIKFLIELKELGYHVPQSALDRLQLEIEV